VTTPRLVDKAVLMATRRAARSCGRCAFQVEETAATHERLSHEMSH
jgi:hypothetical protein